MLKEILKHDFGYYDRLEKKLASLEDANVNLVMHPLDVELFILECQKQFSLKPENCGKFYLFGIEIERDYNQKIGFFEFKNKSL